MNTRIPSTLPRTAPKPPTRFQSGLMGAATTLPKPVKPVPPVTSRIAGTAMKHPVNVR